MAEPFRIGVTRDFLRADGTIGFGDIGLARLEAAGVAWEFLAEDTKELSAAQVAPYDGLLVLGPKVTAATLAHANRLAIVARFGVGYDTVDVPACTAAGVMLTITPDGVRRPVAAAALTLLLALSHKLLIKDRLTRQGRWGEKLAHMGQGLTGRTLGVVGLGNIGREILRLAAPLEMKHLGYDPYARTSDLDGTGILAVELDALLANSDFVVIACTLTDETRHLLNAARIARMKPTAYLINVARGPIVDQRALTEALQAGRIQGAGLDVFEQEPVDPADPLLALENVIVAPHAICWTDECFAGIGQSACESLITVANGGAPRYLVNPEVLDTPESKAKLTRWRK